MKRKLWLFLAAIGFCCIAPCESAKWHRTSKATLPKKVNRKKAVELNGSSSMGASIFNLVNNVAGAGILALSAGQAKGTGWVPSLAICALLGAISARTFAMIGEACEWTGEQDFKGLWAATMGERSAYMVDSMICILCFSCAVIYSGILGDLITSLLAQITHHASSRTRNMVAITVAALWPMSLIKNLSALAFTSVLGFCAILYTVLFVIYRSLDGSYALPAGKFVSGENALKLMPSFAKSSMWNIDFSSLVLASNMGLAYIAHYNGPNFYRNLKDTNAKRFSSMVNLAFAVLILLYSVTMEAGYSTFGDACQGNLLLNYHHDDILSTLARVATLASILFGFPLVMAGAREGFVGAADAFGVDLKDSHFAVVTALLVAVTIIACTVQDVSLVVGLTGAAMGSFIVYICPALIYTNAVRLTKGVGSPEDIRARRYLALVPFGAIIGALGVFMTLNHH